MKKLQITNYKLQILTALMFSMLFKINFAQTAKDTGKYSFSLKQCIDYALQNQGSIKNVMLDETVARDKVNEVAGMGYPQINSTTQFSNNDPSRRMFMVGTGSPSFLTGNKAIPAGEVAAFPNFFQLQSSGDAGVSISQLIFNSSYLVGLQAAKTFKELSVKTTEQTKIQIIEGVTKAYYLVLINEERIKLFDTNISRLDSLLSQTKVMYQNGFVEKIDVDRLQVSYNNMKTEKEKFDNLLLLGKFLLQYQMSMPLESTLTISEKISDFKVENANVTTPQKSNYSNRIEYTLLQTTKKIQQLDIKNLKLSYLPRISAFANLGFSSQNNKFDYFTKSNLWYNYGLYGINITLPIFDGLQNFYKTQQSKLKLKKIENDISTLELSINLQMKSSEISFKNNLLSLETQSKNIELATEVARVTKEKYRQGVGSSLEVITAEAAFWEAQTNYFNSLYDALISKVDYDKAMGTLTK
ncbi:MAG: TolC family protein [Bacteroidetes bacterium]|nr:TolC family protein [Bacteroidota bacterium]